MRALVPYSGGVDVYLASAAERGAWAAQFGAWVPGPEFYANVRWEPADPARFEHDDAPDVSPDGE